MIDLEAVLCETLLITEEIEGVQSGEDKTPRVMLVAFKNMKTFPVRRLTLICIDTESKTEDNGRKLPGHRSQFHLLGCSVRMEQTLGLRYSVPDHPASSYSDGQTSTSIVRMQT